MANLTYSANRRILLAALSVTIVLGGLSRLLPLGIPWWDKYVGDVAYAAFGSLAITLLWKRAPVILPPITALAGCIAVELFQLTGIPLQLNASEVFVIRAFAYLVLGSAFSWWDILAYGVGVVLAAIVDAQLARKPG